MKNEVRRSNIFKVRHAKNWTIKDVVEHFSDKPYEEVVKEQAEKRKAQ